MASINGTVSIAPNDLYSSTADRQGGLNPGAMVTDGNTGKKFRYALNGAVALVVGNLLQEPANDTTYANMAVTATAAGERDVNVTNGTSTITSAQFEGGTLSVYTAGGIAVADEYTIVSVRGTLTTGGALVVSLDRPLRTAWTTSAKVNMKRSMWSGVVAFPTTQTGVPCGVAIFPIAAGEYGWVQTHGECAVLSDGSTFAVGSDLSSGSGTAGAVTVGTAGTTKVRVGAARQVAAAAKGISAFLQID